MADERMFDFPGIDGEPPGPPDLDLPPVDPGQPPATAPGGYDDDDDDNTTLKDLMLQFQPRWGGMNTRLNQGLLTGTSLNQRLNVLNDRFGEQQSRISPDASTVGERCYRSLLPAR